MQQTSTIQTPTGYNSFGDKTLAAAVMVKCKFEDHQSQVFIDNDTKEEYTADATMHVMPTVAIDNDYIVMYNSTTYQVIKIDTFAKTVTSLGSTRVRLKLIKV